MTDVMSSGIPRSCQFSPTTLPRLSMLYHELPSLKVSCTSIHYDLFYLRMFCLYRLTLSFANACQRSFVYPFVNDSDCFYFVLCACISGNRLCKPPPADKASSSHLSQSRSDLSSQFRLLEWLISPVPSSITAFGFPVFLVPAGRSPL